MANNRETNTGTYQVAASVRKELWLVGLLAAAAFLYYFALYARELTWIYTSGDAGDWLVQLRWWMVPHTYGKPLFISLVHAVSYLPFGTDVDKITVFLAALPGAMTIGITYLIAYQLTSNRLKSLTAAVVLLGALIFTSQSTVVEQYALMGMLFSLFYYFYILRRKKLCMLFLGLLMATHVVGIVICLLVLARERPEIRKWLGAVAVFLTVGLLPYTLILVLMYLDTPRLLAGSLSVPALAEFLMGNPTGGVSLAAVAFPQRLLEAAGILAASLGFAIVPAFKAMRGMDYKLWSITVVIVLFGLWFYTTNIFPSTWKYVVVILPAFCGMAAAGLIHMKKRYTYLVLACAMCLMLVNGVWLNPNKMAAERPLATEYVAFLQELPDGSGILVSRGGPYGFGLFYELSKGKDLVPIALSLFDEVIRAEEGETQSYLSYLEWAKREYGVEGASCMEITQNLLEDNVRVFFPDPMDYWFQVFEMQLIEPEPGYMTYRGDGIYSNIYEVTAVK